MTKCAECKAETERPKYCSAECLVLGSKRDNKFRYERIHGFYAMMHSQLRTCLGPDCDEAFAGKSIAQRFCCNECAVAYRRSDAPHTPMIIVQHKLEIAGDGAKTRRQPTIMLATGNPDHRSRSKLRRPYILRQTKEATARAWNELQAYKQRAEASGLSADFLRYVLSLAGG